MIDELKQLRAHCVDTIARIDMILAGCVEWISPASECRPLVVAGRCEAITQHAIDRFRERTGSKKSEERVCDQIHGRIASAQEMELKPRFRVIELLAHGTPARYFRHADLLFVVEGGKVVTIHHGTADRWIPKANA